MGIRLETALPNQHFLFGLALWRFILSMVSALLCVNHFSQSALESPLYWLLFAFIWICLALGFFFAAIIPLCYLQRPLDFCENGFSCQTFELSLLQLECVRWKQERFRLLGILPVGHMCESMILVFRDEKNKRHKLRVSGFYYKNLRSVFDAAYLDSLPWELIVQKRRLKKRRVSAPNTAPIEPLGPMVPPDISAQKEPPATSDDHSDFT